MKKFLCRAIIESTGEIFEKQFTARTRAIAGCKMCQYCIKNGIHFDVVEVKEIEQ